VVNIALSGWPENFGNYVINMDSMFYAFASGASSLISLKIPDFPVGFGSQTTNMSYMFQDLAYQAYKLTLFQYPNFPVGFGSQAKTLRQMFDRSLLSTGVRNITIVFPAGFGQNTTTMYNMFTWVGGSGMTIDWSRTETFQSNANASGMFGNFSYGDGGLTLIFNTSKSAQTFAGKINSYDASKTTKIERSIVYFNTNGKFNVPEQEVSPSDKVIKPTNPKGYTFVNWYTNTDLTGTPFNFNTPINYNLTLYAVYTKNIEPAPQPVSVLTPTFATIKLLKIHAPITRFSVKKNKKVKFKYMLIYSNGMIKQNIKNIKYKKIGRKKVTIKAGNKRLKLVIRVVKRVVKSDGIKIIKVKSNSLIYIKIKSKDAAYYKFPKFSGKSKLNKYGIYTNKHQTIKIKWWGKSFKKKV
jgi:uncharacterized repeat protein (TIGR02543 family)